MKLSSSETGQGLVEYALLFVFVVIVVIVILQLLGISVLDMYEYAASQLGEAFTIESNLYPEG
jgi:Flp pilus assembly pilin Flp